MSELGAEEVALSSTRPSSVRLTAGGAVIAALLNVFWGTNPAALKLAMQDLPPIGATGLRFVVAAVGTVLWGLMTRTRMWPRAGEAKWLLLVIGSFLAQIVTFTLGVHYGTAAHSIVVLYTYPFMVVPLAHFLLDEKATPGRIAGLVIAFTGIVLLFVSQSGRWTGTLLLGDLLQLLSALLLAIEIVLVKLAVVRVEPTRLVVWQMLATAVCLTAYSLLAEQLWGVQASALCWGAVIYQGIFIGAIGFIVWTWQMQKFSASVLAIFGFLSPPTGVIISGLVLHEPVTAGLLGSAGLVALGVVVSSVW